MDICQLAMLRALAAGIDVSSRGLALDAIREVGPGNHFFGCAYTKANFEEAFHHSNIADYAVYAQWSAEGRLEEFLRSVQSELNRRGYRGVRVGEVKYDYNRPRGMGEALSPVTQRCPRRKQPSGQRRLTIQKSIS
jgi:hypothetical protein